MNYKVYKDCNDLYIFFNVIMIFIKHDLKKINKYRYNIFKFVSK